MSDPITFTSTSARFDLPMLFAAQAQKEVFVNEALSRIDGLLHLAIEGEADTPPVAAIDGETWIIGNAPNGGWSGHAGEIALRQGGNWLFAQPTDGMMAFDKSASQSARFDGQWQRVPPIALSSGGTVVDTEARAAIDAIVTALIAKGILPPS